MAEDGPRRLARRDDVRVDAIATTREYTMKVDGGCHCGDIAFEAEIDPDRGRHLPLHGLPAALGDGVPGGGPDARGKVHPALRSAARTYVKTAESGARRAQVFCPECGSQIYATSTGDGPKILSLRAGTLNQRDRLKPRMQIWRRSALAWIGEIDSIPARETQ